MRFVTSNYESECSSVDWPLHRRKNKRVIGSVKGDLKGKIVIKFIGLRAKSFKNAEGTKKWGIKKIKFENYKKMFRSNSS